MILRSAIVIAICVALTSCGGKGGSASVDYSVSAQKNYDKGLKQAAKWCAWWCETHDIPIKASTVAGIGTHAMYSRAYGVSDHTDPGPNFPWAAFLRRVGYYHEHGWLADRCAQAA